MMTHQPSRLVSASPTLIEIRDSIESSMNIYLGVVFAVPLLVFGIVAVMLGLMNFAWPVLLMIVGCLLSTVGSTILTKSTKRRELHGYRLSPQRVEVLYRTPFGKSTRATPIENCDGVYLETAGINLLHIWISCSGSKTILFRGTDQTCESVASDIAHMYNWDVKLISINLTEQRQCSFSDHPDAPATSPDCDPPLYAIFKYNDLVFALQHRSKSVFFPINQLTGFRVKYEKSGVALHTETIDEDSARFQYVVCVEMVVDGLAPLVVNRWESHENRRTTNPVANRQAVWAAKYFARWTSRALIRG